MAIKRREFLGRIAAGAAVLSVPGFLAGCSVQQATAVAAATPENPFLDWFGVDQATAARVMSELTANGADLADLYFQHSRSNSVSFEEGSV
ncbi:MAG: TldD/PmbA family protein, partial [Gammaproteobacteria bacterium]|nr:TldD/PmbA family protein [Gammaproteobacteria bacterium]